MSRFIFMFSSVHRHFVSLNIQNPPLQFEFVTAQGAHITARFHLFGGSAFDVEAFSDQDDEDPRRLADVLMHVMSGLYDAIGLSIGKPHQLTLEGFINLENGKSAQLIVDLPVFEKEIEAAGLNFHDWVSVCVGNPQLRAALRDIRLAMQTPGEVAVHCYRAIERIRQYFANQLIESEVGMHSQLP